MSKDKTVADALNDVFDIIVTGQETFCSILTWYVLFYAHFLKVWPVIEETVVIES